MKNRINREQGGFIQALIIIIIALVILKVLGYDAKTLLYGANAMIYDQMVTKGMSTFKGSEIMGYPYVTGS